MVRRKSVRTRGKFQLSRFFQRFQEGDAVAVTIERAMQPKFPKRIQGRTGRIVRKQGRCYVVDIMDQNKKKQFTIAPIHLKKIKLN